MSHYIRFDQDTLKWVYAHGVCSECRKLRYALPPLDSGYRQFVWGYDARAPMPPRIEKRCCTGLWRVIKGILKKVVA